MAEEQQFLTAEGAEELRRELEHLITVKRPALATQLNEAIDHGDLSENADYHDAKEQQAFLEGRIQYLENLLHHATIIEETEGGGEPVEVLLGMEITIQSADDPPETYRIVGAAEADPRNGKISNESPIGSTLLGRRKGDVVKVHAPGGEWEVKILKISR